MKYQKTIEAIQWNGKNFKELKSRFGSSIMCDTYNNNFILKVKDDTKIDVAKIGDYVFVTGKGYIKLIKQEDFKKNYLDNGFIEIKA